MNNLDFVKLAVSKDCGRYNMTDIYRDTHELVATDGHRLHLVEGLPESKPGFLSGMDVEFPDWRQVVPADKDITADITFHLDSVTTKQLKAMLQFVKSWANRSPIVSLSMDDERRFVFMAQNKHARITTAIECLEVERKLGDVVGIDLAYLFAALEPMHKESPSANRIRARFTTNMGPMRFDAIGLGTAIIMPCKLEK